MCEVAVVKDGVKRKIAHLLEGGRVGPEENVPILRTIFLFEQAVTHGSPKLFQNRRSRAPAPGNTSGNIQPPRENAD